METFLKTCLIVVFILFRGYTNIFTQTSVDSTKKDSSLMKVDGKEYRVLAFQGYDFSAGIRTIEIPSTFLKYNGSISNLSDALQTMGGVYMRSYGNGMNNAVTLRGFGPERTSTLWNGIPINNAGLGQLDMNLMPGGLFNSIKLVVGSSSTQYGSGAQGGSLLLEYRPDFNNKFSMTLQQEYGSFFTWNSFAQFNYGNKNIQGRSAFIRSSSLNNYAFKDKSIIGFPTRETVNADYFSYQAMQDLFFKFKKNWHLSLHGWYTYTDRKTPPAMGAANNHSQQFDNNLRVMSQIKKSFDRHDIQIQIAYINDQLIFHTDAFKDSSSIHTGQVQFQYIYHPSESHNKYQRNSFTLMTGGNFSINYSEYKYYTTPATELRGNVFAMINYEILQRVKISAGVRQQFSSNYVSYPSAHVGINHLIVIKGRHRIKYQVGFNTAYRMPTLNDLYWVPGGNPNLKPEYSWNTENSWLYRFSHPNYEISTEVVGYFGRTSNWIQWTPTPLGYWEPQNLTSVQTAGFESSVGISIKRKNWNVQLKATYNFVHATDINNEFKQLIYIPQHSVKGTFEIKWNEIYLNIYPSFNSKRFTLSDNTQYIPSFFLLNIQTGYTLKLKPCNIGFYLRLNNVTHADYQMMINRPMPGINFQTGINFYLNNITTKQNNK